ncbi:MAG TPA: DinB family protein [Bryobacteraceae bacterium]|nr:DinB family protein [Bryobacteraceae bacterium]
MKLTATLLLCALGMAAQTNANLSSKSPLISSSQFIYGIAKNDVLKSADKIPDNLWSFRPTPEVRTVGELFAHIADGQYEFCSAADGTKMDKGVEKNAKTKADIVAAVKAAFAYCDGVYAKMTDATATDMMSFFGMKATKIGLMDFNTAHTMEHYGNLVTYMRLKGIVPPSSEGQK